MAKFVIDNAYFAVGTISAAATDLRTYTRSVTVNFTAAEQDKTVMGNTAMARLSGLKDASIDAEFVTDFADGTLDVDLWNWYNNGLDVAVYVAAEGATPTASNPVYTGTMICTAFTPISGSVGDAAMSTANFVLSIGEQMDRVVSA